MDTGSLDRFGCTGHWASSGCIRLLTAPGIQLGSGGGGGDGGALRLMPSDAFAALWARGAGGEPGGGWHVPYVRLLPLEHLPLERFT